MTLKKNSFLTIAVVCSILLAAIITSCKKTNSDSASGSLSASLNGAAFQPVSVQGIQSKSLSYTVLTGLQVQSSDSMFLSVSIPDTMHLNQPINLAGFTTASVIYQNTKGTKRYVAGSGYGHGSITLTSWDSTGHKIAGTFTAFLANYNIGTDSVVVSNGQFNSSYTITP
jgi:hypothetical protein